MAQQPQLTPQQMADLSGMFYALSHDPQWRPHVAQMVAHKFPQRAASFTDVAQRNEIQKLRNEWQQEKQLAKSQEIERALDRQRDELISSGRYTREQTDEIKGIITRHGGTLDFNQAAVLYAHEKPQVNPMDQPPEYPASRTWEFPTVNGRDGKPIPFGEFIKNPNAAAQNAAYQVITDFRKRSGLRT
jgi:hypothetical protein